MIFLIQTLKMTMFSYHVAPVAWIARSIILWYPIQYLQLNFCLCARCYYCTARPSPVHPTIITQQHAIHFKTIVCLLLHCWIVQQQPNHGIVLNKKMHVDPLYLHLEIHLHDHPTATASMPSLKGLSNFVSETERTSILKQRGRNE